ncbi:MAG: CHASE domain-containing protein, partial [Alphaproteobacteria bacterium]
MVLLGVTLSTIGFVHTRKLERDRVERAFERPAAHYTAVVAQAIDRYVEVVNSIGSFMVASNEVDRWEFYALAENNLPRYPGIQSLSWIPRVADGERAAYEQQAQTDGLFGFQFMEGNAREELVPAATREEYFPVYYVEPFEGNEGALGFDLASEATGRIVLGLARDSGQIIATQRARLFPETAEGAALVTVRAVYGDAEPTTVAERREALVGFVVGVFRIGDLIETTLSELATTNGLDVYLYDTGAASEHRLIYYHPSPFSDGSSAPVPEARVYEGLHSATTHNVAGRDWTIVVKPTAEYFEGGLGLLPWTVALYGLFLTAVLVYHLAASANRTRVIERAVTERTAELRRSNEALEMEIHERERAEKERMALERELLQVQKMESLGTLAGGIAHEINTPVLYVGENLRFLQESFQEFTEILAEDREESRPAKVHGLGKEDRDYLLAEIPDAIEQSMEGVQRISEIVQAIKEFSYPEAKAKSEVDVNHAIATTITVSRNQYRHVADLETDFDATLPPVPCLPGELNQVMLNLIVNAAHAIEDVERRERGRITVVTRNLGTHAEIRVSDDGIGVSKESAAKIFDPFFTTKEPGKGSGQGLAIAHTIVTKKHGGTIQLDSEEGKGTTFIIRLPL